MGKTHKILDSSDMLSINRIRRLFFPVPKENMAAFTEHVASDILYKSCTVHLLSALLQALNILIFLSRIIGSEEFVANPADMGFFYFQVLAFLISVTSLVIWFILRKKKPFATLGGVFYCATILLMITQGFLSGYEYYAINQFFRLIIYFVVFSTLVNYSPLKGFFVLLSGCFAFALSGSFFSIHKPRFYTLVGIHVDINTGLLHGYVFQNLVFTIVLCICIFAINYRKAYRDFVFNKERNEMVHELDKANERLQDISVKDALTSLNNRRALDEYASRVWDECHQNGETLSVMMFDADYFKAYNDGFGHQAGDDALRTISEVLKRNFSFMRGMLARYGGEEFIAVVPGMEKNDVISAAENIRAEIESFGIANPIPANPDNILTMSIGIYITDAKEAVSMDKCIGLADDALYRAKAQGRNTVVVDAPDASNREI